MQHKTCNRCGVLKPFSDFSPAPTSTGVCARCKPCLAELARERRRADPEGHRERERAWAARNPEKRREYARRNYAKNGRLWRDQREYRYQKQYGITIEDYDQMLAEQGGCCLICQRPQAETGKFRLAVDHCHDTGRVRGLLCQRCNAMLGWYEKHQDSVSRYLPQG